MVDARTRTWADGLLRELEIPTRLLPALVEPGTLLGGLKGPSRLEGTPVVAPACHDTGSAVASVPAFGGRAFLSSGTWSLLGTEIPQPIISPRTLDANFTNEGGVCGTTRLLKNIGGLWLLQSCRRGWSRDGHNYDYAELMDAAGDDRHAFISLFDPDDPAFLHELQIVGGGSRNRLLNQFTADATGRTVLAGPAEATALGNIAMQMLATGAVSSLADARRIIEYSFPVDRFEPEAADRWGAHYRRFQDYVELTCV